MLAAFGKPGVMLLGVVAVAGGALVLAPGSAAKPYTAWVFDPSSARNYESLAFGQVELVPSRLLGVRVTASALAGVPCGADVVELEAGSTRRGLQAVLPSDGAAITLDMPRARLEMWRDGGQLMAIPRDVNPVVLAYNPDIWRAAGIDLEPIQTWEAFIQAAQRLEASAPHVKGLELPRGNAAILLLMLQQQGVDLRLGLDQPVVAEIVSRYVQWARTGVGMEPSRRLEGTAAALESGRLAALIVPDWKLGQLRRLTKTPLRVRPLPGGGPTPTWGGTGVGIPRMARELSYGAILICAVAEDEVAQRLRFRNDGIVPASNAVRAAILSNPKLSDDDKVWLHAADSIGPVPISGEATSAVQRELNGVLRWAVANEASASAIRERLRAADDRLRDVFAPGEAK